MAHSISLQRRLNHKILVLFNYFRIRIWYWSLISLFISRRTATVFIVIVSCIFGLVVGSFIATLTIRWPASRSIGGRSRCGGCGRQLTVSELVPLLSFVALRGRCRTCSAAIGWRQPAIEITGGIIGGTTLAVYPDLAGVFGAGFGWVMLTLALLDFEHFWLPDRLTLPLAAAGLMTGLLLQADFDERVIGAAAGYVSLWTVGMLYRLATGRHGLGGGDPKLFAAIGAWLGVTMLPTILLAACALGFLYHGVDAVRGRRIHAQAQLPFGTMLAVAAWTVFIGMGNF